MQRITKKTKNMGDVAPRRGPSMAKRYKIANSMRVGQVCRVLDSQSGGLDLPSSNSGRDTIITA